MSYAHVQNYAKLQNCIIIEFDNVLKNNTFKKEILFIYCV